MRPLFQFRAVPLPPKLVLDNGAREARSADTVFVGDVGAASVDSAMSVFHSLSERTSTSVISPSCLVAVSSISRSSSGELRTSLRHTKLPPCSNVTTSRIPTASARHADPPLRSCCAPEDSRRAASRYRSPRRPLPGLLLRCEGAITVLSFRLQIRQMRHPR